MKTSIYVTNATIGAGTGGGIVAYNESSALGNVTLLKRVLSRNDIDPTRYNMPNNPFLYDYLALHWLGRWVDVDIAHLYGGPFSLTVTHLKEKGTKVFVTIAAHNLELSVEEHERWVGKYPYIHMTDPFLSKLYNQYIIDADVVICPSKMSADYTKKKLDLKNEIVVIPHGTDLPKEVPPFPQKFGVACIGVNGPDKGLVYFRNAFALANLPHDLYLLAGYGTERLGGRGYVQNVEDIYKNCWIYVQPSITESFGIEVLEAMSFGRPVIVTEGAGVHEIIEDGKEGFIVPIRNPEAIAEKIRWCYDDPDEVKRMGQNARQKAEQYTWEKIRKQYEEIYLEAS